MKTLVFLIFLNMFVLCDTLFCQQTAQKFVDEVNYWLYLPDNYGSDTTKKWPVLLFLHGRGEKGPDLEKVKVHGPPKLINAGEKMPFIVVSPQAPQDQSWYPDIIMLMLNDLKHKYKIDEGRIYLTGLSMGGMGTWAIAEKYPELFAAIAPIAGAGDPSQAWTLRHMPVWIFHGAKDPLVNVENAYIMHRALQKYNNVKLTIYPEAQHDSWSRTYKDPNLYTWLLSHKRFVFDDGSMPEQPEKFVGTYVSTYDNSGIIYDTAQVTLKEGKLFVKLSGNRNQDQQIFPAGVGSFYFQKTNPNEIKFNFGKEGMCDSFEYYRQSYTSRLLLNYKKIK